MPPSARVVLNQAQGAPGDLALLVGGDHPHLGRALWGGDAPLGWAFGVHMVVEPEAEHGESVDDGRSQDRAALPDAPGEDHRIEMSEDGCITTDVLAQPVD